jgi:hypothetical protein
VFKSYVECQRNFKIKVPNSGKVTQAEFDALGKKTDSMKDTDGNIIFIVPNKLSSPTIYF